MLASEVENGRWILKVSKLDERTDELTLKNLIITNLKERNEYIENKVKSNVEIE